MEKSNLNSGRNEVFLASKTRPYYKELQFFKNLSEWPAEW